MLATAPITDAAPTTASPSNGLAPRLRPQLTVEGTVCSAPTLLWTSTGVAVAHFRLRCDDLVDARLRALADRETAIIDVTVWRADAILAGASPEMMNPARFRAITDALKAGQPAGWSRERHWARPLRLGAHVAVEGTPRAGCWHPIGRADAVPLGIVTERLPRAVARR